MRRLKGLARASRAGLVLSLSLIIITLFTPSIAVPAVPSGVNFNHIVIIAMENQYYGTVLGTGGGASCCTFLASLLPSSSTVLNYHSYCNDGDTDPACPSNPASSSPGTNGACSAACYTALTAGNTYNVYGGLASGSVTATNIFDRLTSASLTWKAFCEGYCGRKADHFPLLQYSDTYSLTCNSASSENCHEYTDPTASSGNVVAYSDLISEANSASPANYIWFTPTDCHNMHGDTSCTNGCTSYSTVSGCASQGDSYLQQLLIGSGSLSSPASGSLLSTSLFTNPNSRTLLLIWWDEGQSPGYGLPANLEYGPMIRQGYTSKSNSYDEYSTLQTIENNWNLPCLSLDCNAPVMSDLLRTSTTTLTGSFSYTPSSPQMGQPATFMASASGGTSPYAFSWSFGDGSNGTGSSVTHYYASPGSYMVTLNVKDSNSTQHIATSHQTVSVTSPPPPPAVSFTFNPSSPTNASTIQFIARASGGTAPYSYSWNFGDLSTATGANTEHIYTKTGIYTVTVTITDSTGKTSGTSQGISINSAPKPSTQPPPSHPPSSQPSTGAPCILCNLTSLLSTASLLFLTVFGAGALSVSFLLARYNAHNRRLSAILARNASRTTGRPHPRRVLQGARMQERMLKH